MCGKKIKQLSFVAVKRSFFNHDNDVGTGCVIGHLVW
jgi:hypothetical protein